MRTSMQKFVSTSMQCPLRLLCSFSLLFTSEILSGLPKSMCTSGIASLSVGTSFVR